MPKLRLAVVGAGAIGLKHIRQIDANSDAALSAIVDPSEKARSMAASHATPWFASLDDMFADSSPDGVILATPNNLHLSGALNAIRHGVPVLVEKPIATTVDDAFEIARASEAADVPVLVGHHRRHNPIIRAARDCVASGRLGRITSVTGLTLFYKPDEYFEPEWRRSADAGPVLINLVHGIDDLRFICGDIELVRAVTSSATRGFDAEDSAAIILRFASGALGTFALSDATVAPWSWELASGENPDYPRTDASCYLICGTHGSLALPGLDLFSYGARRSWHENLQRERIEVSAADPLAAQLRHFIRVVRREEYPVCDPRDAVKTLAAIEAVRADARSHA